VVPHIPTDDVHSWGRETIRLRSALRWHSRMKQGLCFAGALRVAAHDLDTVGVDLAVVVELEVDFLDDEGPDVVAEAVGIEVALGRRVSGCGDKALGAPTLKVRRALTLSASTSATALSKFARMRMASCGSMRRSVMSVSSVSVRAPPTLRLSAQALVCGAGESTPAAAVQLVVLGRFGGHGGGRLGVCGGRRRA
jgi:hypothetical protein